MKKISSVFFAVLGIGFMAVIFKFSSQNGVDTNILSGKFTEKLAGVLFQDYNYLEPEVKSIIFAGLNLFIRKAAHFTMYFLTGFVLFAFFRRILKSLLVSGAISVGICFAYAVSDEFHQSFTPGRTPLLKDIFIDTAGALTGVLLCFMAVASIMLCKSRIKKYVKGKSNSSSQSPAS